MNNNNTTLPYLLEKYVNPSPHFHIGGVSIITDTRPDGTNGRIMLIDAGSGFGYTSVEVSSKWFMKVDHNLDYEVSFWFKQPTVDPSFELSMNSFKCDNTELQTVDITAGAPEKIFIPDSQKVSSTPDVWHFARYIIFGYQQPLEPAVQPITSLAVGTNLIMEELTSKIIVNLLCTNDELRVWNFKVKPLRTQFSTGFVQGTNMLEIWRKNNNTKLTDDSADKIANQLLLPYNTSNITIKL